jgi:hypothetical protein
LGNADLSNKGQPHEDVWGSAGISPFLSSALDGTEWLASRPCRFTPGGAPGSNWIGWVGPRAGLDVTEKRKICFLFAIRTPTIQRVARRYTDWAIVARFLTISCYLIKATELTEIKVDLLL